MEPEPSGAGLFSGAEDSENTEAPESSNNG